ncbi:MAG: nucleotidyltransferase family protein [Planctomycetaceae bacterium]
MAAPPDDPWADVTALVLCGGLGTRLSPIVADRPKGLADIGGRPFLDRLLDQLADAGLGRAFLCTGHMAASIRTACGDQHGGMTLDYSAEDRPLGTAGALRLALPRVATRNVLVLNGDSYCHVDLRGFHATYLAATRKPAIVLVEVPDAARFGRVECDAEGFVRRFSEKSSESSPGVINAGIYLLPTDLLRTIPEGRAVSLEREIFPVWLSSGLRGYRCDGPFIDIGTPESYDEAARFFAGASGGGGEHAGN